MYVCVWIERAHRNCQFLGGGGSRDLEGKSKQHGPHQEARTRNKPVGCGCVVVLAAAASTSFHLRQGLQSWGVDVHMAKEPPGELWGSGGDEIRHPHLCSEAPHFTLE